MLIACWSPKGGTGTTVVSCGLALVLSRSGTTGRPTSAVPPQAARVAPSRVGPSRSSHPTAGPRSAGVLVADLSGDVPAVLGVPAAPAPGLSDWLVAGADVPADALPRLEVEAGPGLRLLAWGDAPSSAATAVASSERGEVLAAALAADGRPVVVDCGSAASGAALAVAAAADLSLLVIRPCYLALRKALAAPIRPAGVVLVNEPGRVLSPSRRRGCAGHPRSRRDRLRGVGSPSRRRRPAGEPHTPDARAGAAGGGVSASARSKRGSTVGCWPTVRAAAASVSAGGWVDGSPT